MLAAPGSRLGRGRSEGGATRARSGAGVLLVTAALIVTAAVVSLASKPSGAVGRNVPIRPVADTRAVQSPLFRIAGCRVGGEAVAYRHGPARREVAFGFDDGPAPDTAAFVSMLEHSHAQATFFMIGREVKPSDRELLLRELRDGDVLGDHTFDHPDLDDVRDVRAELSEPIEQIRSLTGYRPCLFRPPYGDYDASVLKLAAALGLATVLWNVDPADYTRPGTQVIVSRVLAQVQPGSIVISHDGGGPREQTLAAYPAIIHALRERGFQIVTIPRLLGFRPVYVPCEKLCDGIGIPRRELPADAVLEHAP